MSITVALFCSGVNDIVLLSLPCFSYMSLRYILQYLKVVILGEDPVPDQPTGMVAVIFIGQ